MELLLKSFCEAVGELLESCWEAAAVKLRRSCWEAAGEMLGSFWEAAAGKLLLGSFCEAAGKLLRGGHLPTICLPPDRPAHASPPHRAASTQNLEQIAANKLEVT